MSTVELDPVRLPPSTKRSGLLTSSIVPLRPLPASPAEPAALLPDRFQQWFAGRGWSPREHQLALLEKARDDRSALLIAPTGAGKTLAGFLPTLVELSLPQVPQARSSPLPPRSGGEGSGVGGGSASSLSEVGTEPGEAPPTPDPSARARSRPTTRCARGGGEKMRRGAAHWARGPEKSQRRHATSSPPGAACSAAAACTRSTSRRSRRSRSISRAIWKRRSRRWVCRSRSRPAPATRRCRGASASAAIRRTSC